MYPSEQYIDPKSIISKIRQQIEEKGIDSYLNDNPIEIHARLILGILPTSNEAEIETHFHALMNVLSSRDSESLELDETIKKILEQAYGYLLSHPQPVVEELSEDKPSMDWARSVWKQLDLKYQNQLNSINPSKQPPLETPSPQFQPKQYSSEDEKQVRLIQKYYRQKQTLLINPNGGHNPYVKYFLHGERNLSKSLESVKIKQLELALIDGDWSNPIFKTNELEKVLLACMVKGSITFQQFTTVLERQQYQQDFGDFATFQLLDHNNQFTEYTQKVFLPSLEAAEGRPLNAEELEKFRLLIATLPKSEQICFPIHVADHPETHGNSLFLQITSLGSIWANKAKRGSIIATSVGVEEALSLSKYGLDQYVRPIHRLNRLTPREIEEGVRHDIRPTAITLKEQAPFKNIHDFELPSRAATTQHDKYHSNTMSKLPVPYRKSFIYMIDIIREQLEDMHQHENASRKQKLPTMMTSEIWQLVDAEVKSKPQSVDCFNSGINRSTQEFCRLITKPQEAGLLNHGFIDKENKVTPVGVIIFVDMIRNREVWNDSFNVDMRYLSGYDTLKSGFMQVHNLSLIDNRFMSSSLLEQTLKVQLLQQYDPEVLKQNYISICKNINQYIGTNHLNEICHFEREKSNNQVVLKINPEHLEQINELLTKYDVSNKEEEDEQRGCSIM
ncbi:hypothetical protein [Legionella sainthelensi]|uniref:Uncharacterized protein n=1 Tax=Legionella sainthelensi TaxID=28087 RepID=A0A2H5FNB6_9GAMM|nr:hypothetical protein [Legionella sainthelensi]AUH73067.1 hypothetical protein CAB17_14190 [Legionella sainthelensi]